MKKPNEVIVTRHALERLRERFPEFQNKTHEGCCGLLKAIAFRGGETPYDMYVVGDFIRRSTLRDGTPIYLMLRAHEVRLSAVLVLTVLTEDEVVHAGGVRKK